MKKKTISVLLAVMLLLSSSVNASATGITPRWTYVSSVSTGMSEGLNWYGKVTSYPYSNLTHSRVTVKLHAYVGGMWLPLDSGDSGKVEGRYAAAGSTYTSSVSNTQYRTTVYFYVYNNNTLLESDGPFYSYYTTD